MREMTSDRQIVSDSSTSITKNLQKLVIIELSLGRFAFHHSGSGSLGLRRAKLPLNWLYAKKHISPGPAKLQGLAGVISEFSA